MPVDRKTAQLSIVPELAGMSRDEVRELRELMTEQKVEAGVVILDQGTPGNSLYLLDKGSVEVQKNGRMLATLKSPTVFGEIGFLTGTSHVAVVRAAEPSVLLRLPRERFDECIAEGRLVAYKLVLNVARRLAERLRQMDDRVVELLERSDRDPELSRFKANLLRDWRF